ncbi:hypothetical protein AQUCO_06300033v1 [Aquilegia coerulea]|uniref:Uncharacterized protein n=1 Tax=Aquilegia coerulea TaxID=218851 RepID=A0A2G5CCT4_AQUCA|nr:hypothetical protein AQUCO_06300033v1 [Aquilegia coerulea]
MQILNNSKIGINGIYGNVGVGKTTVMRRIRDQLGATGIFDKIFWVTLSKDLSLYELQSDIARQMHLDLSMYEGVQFRAAQIFGGLKKINQFLIIFDNMCNKISLKELGVPRPKAENGCKIVVITRSIWICKDMNSDMIMEVQPLLQEEAWSLFVNKAGDVVHIPEIKPLAQAVVRNCCGLPIGLVSVGHAMRDEVSVDVWRKTSEYLQTPEVYFLENIVFKLLRFSYNRLSSDKVQNCFLYSAFFPEDYIFKPEELIRYWMAEKFIYRTGDIVAEIDEGFKILRELQDAIMLQMFTERGEVFFKMHASLWDLAIRILKPELCVKAALGLLELLTCFDPTTSPLCERGATIEPQAHSLKKWFDIISPFFSQIFALKFLDLSYSIIIELPPSLSELIELRVLFLHYCTRLKKIPCLKNLKKLRSLCLCGITITKLPQGMEGLVSLRSLDLSETTKLESIQAGMISSLSHLEELRFQGSGLCKMDSPLVANYLMEMRSLMY